MCSGPYNEDVAAVQAGIDVRVCESLWGVSNFTKAMAVGDCFHQLRSQLLAAGVLRDEQVVEARVGSWKPF